MLLDLEFKFLETTGYVYNAEMIINALNITRRWDIVLTGEASYGVRPFFSNKT